MPRGQAGIIYFIFLIYVIFFFNLTVYFVFPKKNFDSLTLDSFLVGDGQDGWCDVDCVVLFCTVTSWHVPF